ncbi:MAG: Hsp20/alpha crystallin family protein [Rubrivivax sp.]|nr:Hsp20/alpha crystallin family protein [Rubrivivax sp.]
MYRSLFPRDLFSEFDRLQREMHSVFDAAPAIRGMGRGGYPALNVGGTPQAVEVTVFAPGLEPSSIEVQLERGVLTLSGVRPELPKPADDKSTLHINERFSGRFRRVLSLPDDIDADDVQASYRDGVLRVRIGRRQPQQARRIAVQ